MATLSERIKKARIKLRLSQEYVANYIGINRTAMVDVESGKRKVSAEELGKLSELFHISADELLNGRSTQKLSKRLARGFALLDKSEQKEILDLIEFKGKLKETGTKIEEQVYVVHVNSKIKNDIALGELIRNFKFTKMNHMPYKRSLNRIISIQEDSEGKEEVRNKKNKYNAIDGMTSSIAREVEQNKLDEIIISMNENGLPNDLIAKIAKVTVDYVEEVLSFIII